VRMPVHLFDIRLNFSNSVTWLFSLYHVWDERTCDTLKTVTRADPLKSGSDLISSHETDCVSLDTGDAHVADCGR